MGEDFQIVALFDSPLENLQQYADRHQASFPILADPLRDTYVRYAIDHSLLGVFKAIVMHTLLYAMLVKGYWPFSIKGSIASMPTNFLVDRQGIIRVAHYGSDEGDHLPFDDIKNPSANTVSMYRPPNVAKDPSHMRVMIRLRISGTGR